MKTFIFLSQRNSFITLFFLSILVSIIGILTSLVLFPQEASVISIFLTSFALLNTVNKLFDINRQEIWGNIATPYQANKKLGISLLFIFIGVMLGYGIITLFLRHQTAVDLFGRQLANYRNIGPGFNLTDMDFGTYSQIVKHNFLVLLVVLFFALLYRAGGLLIIIVWNASVWGVIFSYISKNIIQYIGIRQGLISLLLTYACVSMHLIAESIGYVLCAMAGLFISKACVKYINETTKLIRVIKASIFIFIISISMIFISALIESYITPKIVSLFSNSFSYTIR